MFANTNKEITIIYHSEDQVGKKIIAYAQSESLPIHDVDLLRMKVTETQWAEIASRLGIEVKDLINREDPDFLQKFKGVSDLDDNDWLKLLEHNPDILRAPIVMKGDKVVMMANAQDMLHFLS